MKQRFHLLLVMCSIFFAASLNAQEEETTRILFVFDASNSMNGVWHNNRKIKLAVKLLNESIDKLKGIDNLELGLRVYGHQFDITQGQQNCDDTQLMVPIGKYRHKQIKDALLSIIPRGTTPIARSLEKSAKDFGDDTESNNVIILITDGVEACDEDPCAVSRALQEKNIVLKPFIIGIGIEEEIKYDLNCIGNFFDVTDEESFKNVLDIVLHQAINNTTVQVDLMNDNNEPSETNIPIGFYDNHSKELKYNFIHTLNRKGNPDTLPIDPVFQYDIYVYTIPLVKKTGVVIKAGRHNTIEIDCGQGQLALKMDKSHAYEDLKCLVKLKDKHNIVHVQDFNTTETYLTGTYDLELLTLPRIKIADVVIKQSETYDIIIPQPGAISLRFQSSVNGSIFVDRGPRYELVTRVKSNVRMEQIILQPGNYKIVYRTKNAKEAIYTLEKDFEITSGQSLSLEL